MAFNLLSLARRKSALPSPAESTSSPDPLPAEPAVAETSNLLEDQRFSDLLASFETDVARVVKGVSQDISGAKEKSLEVSSRLGDVKSALGDLLGASERVEIEVIGIAASTDQLQGAASEILTTVDQVRTRSSQTVQSATQSAEDVAKLVGAINEIGSLLNSIDEISSRTNLLALNATIEAARAGEAGRGFAVVAQEVKALSVAAGQSVAVIRERMKALQEASGRAVEGMKRICTDVGELAPVSETIAQAAEEQRTTIVDLATRMNDARQAVSGIKRTVDRVDDMTNSAKALSEEGAHLSQTATNEAANLGRRVSVLLRGTGAADRRDQQRYPIDLAMRVRFKGETFACRSFDVSEGGVLIRLDERLKLPVGTIVEAEISRIGETKLKVVNLSAMGMHCAYEGLTGDAKARIAEVISNFETEHAPLVERAKSFAGEIQQAIEAEIAARRIAAADVFDTDYRSIAETDPVQHRTRYLDAFDKILPPILERYLRQDAKMVFCLAIDRNGYIPVHNAKVSQPQRKGDRAWNTANSRNRRIFDDRAGLLAGRNTRPYQIQTYNRDMGNGQLVQMKEVDVPILIDGKHWGGVRMAYSL